MDADPLGYNNTTNMSCDTLLDWTPSFSRRGHLRDFLWGDLCIHICFLCFFRFKFFNYNLCVNHGVNIVINVEKYKNIIVKIKLYEDTLWLLLYIMGKADFNSFFVYKMMLSCYIEFINFPILHSVIVETANMICRYITKLVYLHKVWLLYEKRHITYYDCIRRGINDVGVW